MQRHRRRKRKSPSDTRYVAQQIMNVATEATNSDKHKTLSKTVVGVVGTWCVYTIVFKVISDILLNQINQSNFSLLITQ